MTTCRPSTDALPRHERRDRRDEQVVGPCHRFDEATEQDFVYLPSVALFELKYGIANSAHVVENTKKLAIFLAFPVKILPFEPADAEHAAEIRADLKRKGTPIGPYDVRAGALPRRDAGDGQHARVRPRAGPRARGLVELTARQTRAAAPSRRAHCAFAFTMARY